MSGCGTAHPVRDTCQACSAMLLKPVEAGRLERRMEALAAREKTLHEQMVEAATDPDRLLALDAELRAVVAEREDAEMEWLAAAEAAE